MTRTLSIRAIGPHFVVTCLAIAALALAACSSAATTTPTAAPTATPTLRVAATLSPGPVVTLPPPAHQPQTIHLIDYPTSGTEVSVGSHSGCSDTLCQGDYIIGYDPVRDAVTGKEVGTLAYECFLVDPGSTLYHCPGNTFTLTGRGQIVFAEVIQHEVGGPPTTGPITGGTGEFLGATGFVVSQKISNGGDFVITITG
jgi:hypothetical protein